MKPIYLLTGLLAWTTLVVSSCSTPQLAQHSSNNDDVYGSTARAVEYQKPARSEAAQYLDQDSTYTEDDYGLSDPYYDMDYYSRINRFYYGSPFRSYYDPYFDGGYYGYNSFSPYYSGFSFGLGFGYGYGFGSSYMGGFWGPYSTFGGYYSPYWGYTGWPYGGYMGGGYYGGGYLGSGYLGNGYLVGTRGNVNYGGRPSRGRENGVGYAPGGTTGFGMGGATRTVNGNVVSGRRTSNMYNPNRGASLDARTRTSTMGARPSRSSEGSMGRPSTERYNAPTRSERPSYTPSTSNGGGMRSTGGGASSGGGGASRPSRGGGRG
jgi:hypothetical protein